MYEIIFSDDAKKQLKNLSFEMKERIGNVIERIKTRPFSFVKKLIESPYYRLRVEDYRVILDIQQNKLVILVIEIGHRKNIYK